MHPRDQRPAPPGPQVRPVKRHHTARYYAHRVRESLTTRVSKLLCSIFLGVLLLVGVFAFILWLSLRPHRPRFFIHEFSVPGLNQEGGFVDAQIRFNVTARNSNQNIGIYYDSMEGAVYFEDQRIGAKPLLFPFYQKPKNTTVVYGVLSGATLNVKSERWMAFIGDRANGSVAFRLEITSIIRFRISTWDSRHHRMHANCPAVVGQDGLIQATYKNKRCPVYFS